VVFERSKKRKSKRSKSSMLERRGEKLEKEKNVIF